jgi:hypothetical protein
MSLEALHTLHYYSLTTSRDRMGSTNYNEESPDQWVFMTLSFSSSHSSGASDVLVHRTSAKAMVKQSMNGGTS